MKLILLKTVKSLGLAGDVVDVKNGYAKNYLIPNKLAGRLNKHSLSVVEAKKRKIERSNKEFKRKKQSTAVRIDRKSFKLEANADDKGTLYSGIGKAEISELLKNNNFDVDVSEIKLAKAIKKTGKNSIDLNLSGKSAKIKIEIIASKD